MSRVAAAFGEFVESIVGFLVMILLAIVAFYVTVFVVSTGAALAGQTPNGNFVVLSAALLVVAAILAGGLSPVSALAGQTSSDSTARRSATGEGARENEAATTPPVADDAGPVEVTEPPEEAEVSEDAPKAEESLGTFQLYKDSRDEWRWRLVHRNGNIIATSGEGYSSDRAARRGMQSVVKNAPDAEVDWQE